MNFYLEPGGKLVGRIRVPGDKSMSHRVIMLGSIAEGTTHVTGFLEGEDALATLGAFRDMGVAISEPDSGRLTIEGVGLDGLQAPQEVMDVGNSGTSIRLMAGLLAGQAFGSVLTGDQSLLRRPMARVIQDHIKKPLADEILFGRLEKGGRVTVDVDKKSDSLCFRFPDRELPAPKESESDDDASEKEVVKV